MCKKTKIMVADDHKFVRQLLATYINREEDMEVVAEASDGQEAIDICKRLSPDVVIMDIGMPVKNGFEATREIKKGYPNIIILVLTVHTDTEYIIGILEAGAAGYLTKSMIGTEIIHAIRTTIAGESVLSPYILSEFMKYIDRDTLKTSARDINLSPKEISLLQLAAKGMNNKAIANASGFSENTVKRYLTDLFQKMNVSSRTEAVVKGIKDRVINISDISR